MQSYPQTASASNADQRLSQIIKLKQLERPDAAYWQRFDQEFRSRQLTTFVQIQPMHTRLRRACLIVARKAAPPVAAAGAVALTFFAVSNTQYLAKSTDSQPEQNIRPVSQDNTAAPEQDSYFIVSSDKNAVADNASYAKDTIYQINVLSSQYDTPNGYQLNATPVTFSPSATAQTNGTNILSKQPNY